MDYAKKRRRQAALALTMLEGEIFIPLSLAELAQPPRHERCLEHIHTCAMIVQNMQPHEAQGVILDYIIANESKVPLFMLNDVPMYVAGYLRGCKDTG